MGGQLSRRVYRHAVSCYSAANLAAVVAIYLYAVVLSPRPAGLDVNATAKATIVLLAYVALAAPLTLLYAHRLWSRTMRWLDEGRTPTQVEMEPLTSLATRLARAAGLCWLGAGLLTGVLVPRLGADPARGVTIGAMILVAGCTVASGGAQWLDRALRPIYRVAFAEHPPPRPAGSELLRRLVLMWALGTGLWMFAIGLAQVGRTPAERQDLAPAIYLLVGLGLVAGVTTIVVAARSVTDRIVGVATALERVQAGDLDVRVPIDDTAELGWLQGTVNDLVAGLREREQMRSLFDGFVGEGVARQALEQGVRLGGERREVTVLFVDLVAYTRLAHRLPPEQVVEQLNDFFGAVVRVAESHGGWVNQFQGDGVVCCFGVPVPLPDGPDRALRAAAELRHELMALCGRHPEMEAGVGVSTGQVVAGHIGTDRRYDYTVVGDAMNEAARLTSVAKGLPSRVAVSGTTLAAAGSDTSAWQFAGSVVLRGRMTETDVYEPPADDVSIADAAVVERAG